MNVYQEKGDKIKGKRIFVKARNINKLNVVNDSGSHKAQTAKAVENAEATIETPLPQYSPGGPHETPID